MLNFLRPLSTLGICAIILTGCQSFVGCYQDDTRCFQNHRFITQPHEIPQLDPQFNYMRVVFNGQVAWLVQGEYDTTQHAPQAVYYSADRNVFKWSQGRLSAIEHKAFSWREQGVAPLNWQQYFADDAVTSLQRQLDLTDGTWSVVEQRKIVPSNEPLNHRFVGNSETLTWLHESSIDPTTSSPHFDIWYAFQADSLEPVYGQQCISTQHCISWQKWNTNHETSQ